MLDKQKLESLYKENKIWRRYHVQFPQFLSDFSEQLSKIPVEDRENIESIVNSVLDFYKAKKKTF